jgi:hypothetical protein
MKFILIIVISSSQLFKEQNSSSEANSRSACQEIISPLWNPKFYYNV